MKEKKLVTTYAILAGLVFHAVKQLKAFQSVADDKKVEKIYRKFKEEAGK
jgi:hypothetical protein